MITDKGVKLTDEIVSKYLKSLIGQFYKILPIKESKEPSLVKYMDSLQREMIGCKSLIIALEHDELYLGLLSILQYLIKNDCSVEIVKCEVFKAISILKKLQYRYCTKEIGGGL